MSLNKFWLSGLILLTTIWDWDLIGIWSFEIRIYGRDLGFGIWILGLGFRI